MSKHTDKWIGKRFGTLKIISCETSKPPYYYVYFNCICDCGNVIKIRKDVILNKVRNGKSISCGCSHTTAGKGNIGKKHDSKAKTHIGEIHNRLTIIDIKQIPCKGYKMICKCECGSITEQFYADLVKNKVFSCGCYGREQQSKTGSKVGLNNCTKTCSKYKWHYEKEGKKINMRSGFEVMFAMALDKEKVEWEYEPKVFKLQDDKRYIPDFYLPKQNKWVEIKGRFTEVSKEKIKEFENMGNNILVIFIKELEKRVGKSYYSFKKEWKITYGI